MKQLILPAFDDPENSVDVFDIDRQNDRFGGHYCVAPAILRSQVKDYWNMYIDSQREKAPANTPWGPLQSQSELAEGIVFVYTTSHGGIWLSPKRQAQMNYDNNFLGSAEWWEEDCDWCIPFLFFAEDIKNFGSVTDFEKNEQTARFIAANLHPGFKEKLSV